MEIIPFKTDENILNTCIGQGKGGGEGEAEIVYVCICLREEF